MHTCVSLISRYWAISLSNSIVKSNLISVFNKYRRSSGTHIRDKSRDVTGMEKKQPASRGKLLWIISFHLYSHPDRIPPKSYNDHAAVINIHPPPPLGFKTTFLNSTPNGCQSQETNSPKTVSIYSRISALYHTLFECEYSPIRARV